jgi:DnaJ like chaperone protein
MSYSYTLWFAFFGLLIGHGPGAITGAIVGFIFDNLRHTQRKNATPEAGGFIGPLFTLLGAVAKSDGRVSEAEIAIAERMMSRMNLDAEQRKQAAASFNAGKQPEFDVTRTINELRGWVGARRDHAFPVSMTTSTRCWLKVIRGRRKWPSCASSPLRCGSAKWS